MSYARVRVEKFGDNFYLQINGQTKQFNRESSDLLTSPIEAAEDFRSGIFSSGFVVKFSDGAKTLAIDFQYSFSSKETGANPLAEIRRRVRLVQETFAKAEAEKEVWEGIVGELPLVTESEELYDVLFLSTTPDCIQVTRIAAKAVTLAEAQSWKLHWEGFFIAPSGKYKVGYKL